jgi:hypothetical protein
MSKVNPMNLPSLIHADIDETDKDTPVILKINSDHFARLSIDDAIMLKDNLQLCLSIWKQERYKLLLIQRGEIEKELERLSP